MAFDHYSLFELDYLQRKALSISEDDIELADFLLDQVLHAGHSLAIKVLLHPPIPPLCTNIDDLKKLHWWHSNNDVIQYTGKGRNMTIEDIPALTDLLTDAFFNFGIDRSSKQTNIFAHNLLFQQPHWQVIDTIDQPQPQRMH